MFQGQAGPMNLWACVVIVLFMLIAWGRLQAKHKRGSNYRFVFHATSAWLLSWACWIALWSILSIWNVEPRSKLSVLVLILSDLNTVLILVTFLALIGGKGFQPIQHLIAFLIIGAFAGAVDGALLYFPGDNWGATLHERWSLVLSAISPVLVGLGFRLRYGANRVFIVGIVYAFLQPAAYESLPGHSIPEVNGVAVFFILSVLKVFLGASALSLLAEEPATDASLIESVSSFAKEIVRTVDPRRQVFPALLVVIGSLVVIAVAYHNGARIAQTLTVYLVAVVATLIAMLSGLAQLKTVFPVNSEGTSEKLEPD